MPWRFQTDEQEGDHERLQETPPSNVVKDLDRLLTLRTKITTAKYEKKFLEDCIEQKVFTDTIHNKVRLANLKPTDMICFQFVQFEIDACQQRLLTLKDQVSKLNPSFYGLNSCDFLNYLKLTCKILKNLRKKLFSK